MKKNFILIIILIIIAVVILGVWKSQHPAKIITSFEECAASGNPIMESYPEQCAAGGQTFTRDVGNEVEKMDMIKITSPRPGAVISTPLTVTGQARGTWYFEASFPVILKNAKGAVLAQGVAQAEGDWMTEDFVPFKAVLNYPKNNAESKKGTLILQKDNPSGLPENDDSLQIPVVIN